MNEIKMCGFVLCALIICFVFKNLKSEYSYGIKVDSNDGLIKLDKVVSTITNKEYTVEFDLNEITNDYYGDNLLVTPYIKSNDNLIVSKEVYYFNLIKETINLRNNNIENESINYILDYTENNYKKVYNYNEYIIIDNPLNDYSLKAVKEEFIKDWNNKFNTSIETLDNFALENVGDKSYYGEASVVKNHKLYKFFNDNNKEMGAKYKIIFDLISILNTNMNIIDTQIIVLTKDTSSSDWEGRFSAYYGFYHILAQIEALLNETYIYNKDYGYATVNYSSIETYLQIQKYYTNNNINYFANGDYEYVKIGNDYTFNYEEISYIGKQWNGYELGDKLYQINDTFKVTEDNVYFTPKYTNMSYSIKYYDGETELTNLNKNFTVDSNDITLPKAEKYGFTFLGWYTSSDFNENSKIEKILKGTTENFVLYAKYEAKPYSQVDVTFDLNGGSWNNNEQTNQTLSTPSTLPTPTREGCKFNGWLSSLDNKVYLEYPGYYDFNNTIEYTAMWEVINMNDTERIEATFEDLSVYLDKNKIVDNDIELIKFNELYNTTIEYESLNESVLSKEGIFNRQYVPTDVTMNIKITSNNESKTYSFEFNTKGYKELTNIASSYVYGGYDQLTEEFFDTMDVIFCAFVLIDVDGGFTGLDGASKPISGTNKTYLAYMQEYVLPVARKKGIRVVASIGGGGSSVDAAYEEIVKSDAKMDNLANNIVKLINEYGFDGADIDWEIPNDAKTFSKLSRKIYTAVKKNNEHHIVTAAIGAGMWQPPKYDLTVSKNYLDYINLMSYNMVGSGGYHHTALFASNSYFDKTNKVAYTMNTCTIEESMAIYKNNYGVDASQIIIGASFYGMMQERTYQNGSYGSWKAAGTISYTSIKRNYLNSDNYDYFYDTNCEAPYILSKDKTVFISYDDPRSIKAKCDYVKDIKAAGIMYWQNGQDTTGDLVRAIKEGLDK